MASAVVSLGESLIWAMLNEKIELKKMVIQETVFWSFLTLDYGAFLSE